MYVRNASCSGSHLRKTKYHIKFFGQIFLKLKPRFVAIHKVLLVQKEEKHFVHEMFRLSLSLEVKFFHVISILSVEFSSSQSHCRLLCSFLRLRDCFIYFSAFPSPPFSFFSLTPKTLSSFLQPYISGYNHRRV